MPPHALDRPPRAADHGGSAGAGIDDALRRALAHHRSGRLAEARALYLRVLQRQPDNLEALYHLGLLLQQAGQPGQAAECYRRVLAIRPKFAEAQASLGLALQQKGENDMAIRHLRKAVKLKPALSEAHVHLGNLYVAQGARRDAARHYQAALKHDPRNAGCHVNLANVFQETGELEKAETHYRKALTLEPRLPAAHNSLGSLLRRQGRLAESIEHYRQALAVAPEAGGFAKLASVLERAHRLEEAGEAAAAALDLAADHPDARLVQAKILARRGDGAAARRAYGALIDDLGEAPASPLRTVAARARADLAVLCEKSGDFDRAMALFEAANRLNRAENPAWERQAAAYVERVRKVDAMMARLGPGDWRPEPPAGAPPAPVFMVGFPRSGTTLVDQILDAHSQVSVLEERTIVDRLIGRFRRPEDELLEGIMGLADGKRLELRQAYWDILRQETGGAPGAPLVVDKLPLNMINLWLIHGLFPEAKIIVSLRDPRDVCLSCFTNLFRLGEGLASFPTLESSAELYAAVMGLWLRYRDLLALDHQVLRYEDLVGDLEGESRRLFAFLGLAWEEEVLGYRQAAEKRYIATPSYHQVVQPLYSSSIGRWRHYRAHLATVAPLLRPFIEAFGYDED